jgi:transposase
VLESRRGGVRIFVCTEPLDMRRGFDGLAQTAREAVGQHASRIGPLFRIERTIADVPRSKTEAIRRAKSRPIADEFFTWCESQVDQVLDESPIEAGIRYGLDQRVALRRFLDDARLPLSNNISELHLRREVRGRRNWLFVSSDDGARVNTVFVSLLARARLHEIEPLAYTRDLLCLLPN